MPATGLLVVVDSYVFDRPFDKVLETGGRRHLYVAAISNTVSDILAVAPTVTCMCPDDVHDILDATPTLGHCDETLLLHALRLVSDHADSIAGLLQHPTSPEALVASYVVSIGPVFNATDDVMRNDDDLVAAVTSVVGALHELALAAPHEDANCKVLYAVVVQALERLPHDIGVFSDVAA
ncbi:hypothetical protein SDRG_12156 [Saprolegnia diclina VS20]|uniref:Uncharacterized protein n=1 Tax=Saprolegnia diclina (strain VS20) TaxID=1156394 RepID=T0RJP1_SAPDV|nr:hypothetical protein SDRG_12156 [Saprolegnia diclina VS20]EQC30097.1 hypothetical protein SDRG_12156 [Saprolegnia diclina VS20]|eukprot:XP_008616440.1 hypothetical protein SDRG_12156 [Saprolegnia diclina VS20]